MKLVHPLASARGKAAVKMRKRIVLPDNTGKVHNAYGIGGPLAGEKRNPTGKGGFGDNPSSRAITARYRAIKRRQAEVKANPDKVTVMEKKPRINKERESIVKEAREIKEMAARCVPDAIDALKDIITNPASSDMAKIAAANVVWDRGYGKPVQANINANMDVDAKPTEINDAELNRRIEDTLKRIEGATTGTSEEVDVPKRPSDLRKLN